MGRAFPAPAPAPDRDAYLMNTLGKQTRQPLRVRAAMVAHNVAAARRRGARSLGSFFNVLLRIYSLLRVHR